MLMRRPLRVLVSAAQVPTGDEIRREYRARVDAYIARMAHVEFLIRNRLVRAEELLAGTSQGKAPLFRRCWKAARSTGSPVRVVRQSKGRVRAEKSN